MFSLGSWLPAFPGLAWGWALLDAFLQGLVGACAVSVLCSLLKVYLYVQCLHNPERQAEKEAIREQRAVLEPLHVLVLTGVLALVGSRVAALVVLEFSLRAVSTVLSHGKGGHSVPVLGLGRAQCPPVCLQRRVPTEEARQSADGGPVFQTVLVRMGGLFILLLTVGRWSDILHVLVSLLGELWCLLHAGVLLRACRGQDSIPQPHWDRQPGSGSKETSG
ncbi:transmembrane protein 82 [Manacus vitellinus]|uniref:transmembrane protein 82 n=1 Tax=Manacus vitellinus TaxID=328815 RepID=UPI00115CB801|nr:transmembrane protein 82 [Manacus vitellinus]